jgi:hypothetical protein
LTPSPIIDKDFSQALSLSQFSEHAEKFFKSPWHVFVNHFEDLTFLTSDYPIKQYYNRNEQNINAIPMVAIPITPKIVILIHVGFLLENNSKYPKNTNKYGIQRGDIREDAKGREFINDINICTIQSAEKYIISDRKNEEVKNLIIKNQNYKIGVKFD